MTARGYASDLAIFILALAAGIGWRLELELRWGWQSLAWINGFHWAVPVSIMLCIGWAVWVGRVRERVVFAAVLVGFAFAVFTAISFAFPLYFAAGPTAVITDVIFGKSGRLVRFLVPLLWASVPLMFCWICRFFGAPITIAQSLASALLFVLSWPVAVFVRNLLRAAGLTGHHSRAEERIRHSVTYLVPGLPAIAHFAHTGVPFTKFERLGSVSATRLRRALLRHCTETLPA